MRWIITITLVLLIGLLAWFWVPRLITNDARDPLSLLNEDVWMSIELLEAEDLGALRDSTALLGAIPLIDEWQLPDSGNIDLPVALFAYTSPSGDGLGLITPHQATWIDSTRYAYRQKVGSYEVHSTTPYELPTDAGAEAGMVRTQAHEPGRIRIYVKGTRLTQWMAQSFQPALMELIAPEVDADRWIEFDLQDQSSLLRAVGIAETSGDQSTRASDLYLLRFAPSNSNLVLLHNADTVRYALAHCDYGATQDPYDQVFIITANNGQEQANENPDQEYRGVPITIGNLPSPLTRLALPWADEAYVAHVGDVVIYGASFTWLVKLIDDYLADDQLINSPYFQPLESAISDASFSLYLRPELFGSGSPYVKEGVDWPGTRSMVFQAFSELPGQKFYTLAVLHHKEIVDEAPLMWTAVLDTTVLHGPWQFVNHYTDEHELLVQDALHQLYLINKDGKTLWKKKLDAPIQGGIKMIDGFLNNKYQLLLCTEQAVHLIDRNGNEVGAYPVVLKEKATTSPTILRYSGKGDYRILVGSGSKVINLTIDGTPVEGWKQPTLNAPLASPVHYMAYAGKDYLMARSLKNTVYLLDRQGRERSKAIQLDSAMMGIRFQEAARLSEGVLLGYDTLGNYYRHTLGNKKDVKNILPLSRDLGVAFTDDTESPIITVLDDRVIALDNNLDVSLDFLLPAYITPEVQWLSADRRWVGLNARESNHYYILDLDGHVIDKMPVRGSGKGLVLDLDKTGGLELVIGNGDRELKAYRLAD